MQHEVHELNEEINRRIEERLEEEGFEQATKANVNLDSRAICADMWRSPRCIVVKGKYAIRALEYYGGFEYIDEEDTAACGDYKFFFATNDRVEEALEGRSQ